MKVDWRLEVEEDNLLKIDFLYQLQPWPSGASYSVYT